MHRISRLGLQATFLASLCAASASVAAVPAPTQPGSVRAWTKLDNGYTFQGPRGVALLADGDVAVADGLAQRIVVMSPDGKFRRSFGGVEGSGPGEFRHPAGVAVNAAGEFLVVDRDNSRLQRFTADGTWLQAIGGPGSDPGQFQFPSAIGIASNGELYVCDQHNHRIVRLSADGAFLSEWGSFGTATGQFQFPASLAIDRYGDVYVTDQGNDRVQKFTRTGTWIRSWGTTGSASGQFQSPAGIAVDELGSVFVGETGGRRIQRFSDTGNWAATIDGASRGPHATSNAPTGMVTNRGSQLFVAEFQSVRLQRFDYNPPPTPPLRIGSPVAIFSGGSYLPNELAADDQGGVYILTHTMDVIRLGGDGQPLHQWQVPPDNAYDSFRPPAGIAFHAGRVFVTDPIHGVVRGYERNGTPVGAWGSFPRTVVGGRSYLSEIRISDGGVVHIPGLNGIERFNLNGIPLGSSTLPSGAPGGRFEVEPDGDVWIWTSTHFERRSSNGDLLHSFACSRLPSSSGLLLDVRPDRGLFVVDHGLDRLRRLDESGNLLQTQTLTQPQGLISPLIMLSIDGGPRDGFWVSDAQYRLVQRFLGPPRVTFIGDRRPDQGGVVELRFVAASSDGEVGPAAVHQYKIFRKLDGELPPDADPAPELPDWELVHTMPAMGSPEYVVNVGTRADATPSERWLTTFLVRAQVPSGGWVDSDAQTGFSSDELAPDAVTQVSAVEDASGTTLHWQPGVAAGTRYRVHRNATPGFEAHEGNAIAETPDTTLLDAGVTGATYAIEAMDDGENLSASVQFNAKGVVGPPGGSSHSFALRRLVPNPSDGRSVAVQLSLADAGSARLELFDASGRRVYEQPLSGLSPGAHEVLLKPARRLAMGVYVIRLNSAHGSRSLRMLVVR